MQRIIGVTELQRNFRAVFDEVARENRPYILTRGSRPEAALIPYETFLQLLELQEKTVLDRFDRLAASIATHNKTFSEEEVAADVATSLDKVRAAAK